MSWSILRVRGIHKLSSFHKQGISLRHKEAAVPSKGVNQTRRTSLSRADIIEQCQRDVPDHNFGPEHQLFLSTIIETQDRQRWMITALERERDDAQGELQNRSVEDCKGNQAL
jgi:hypothetical protein